MEHWGQLAKFGTQNKGGTTRLAYTNADKEARAYLSQIMKEAGLQVHVDAAGNLVGRMSGMNDDLAPVVTGSHIDTVPEGGRFDGVVGVLSAIEVVQSLNANHIRTRHPIEVIVFEDEERGHIGSRAISSGLSPDDLKLVVLSGKTVADGISFLGGDVSKIAQARRNPKSIAAYVELHIEQGGVLEKDKKDIGIVQGFVGVHRWNVTFIGLSNHAGTTPMNLRQDALLAAAEFITEVHRITVSTPGHQVATVGKLEIGPDAPNVIPGVAHLTLEARDLDAKKIEDMGKKFEAAANKTGKDTHTTASISRTYNTLPVLADPKIMSIIADSAKERHYTQMQLPSGAAHDAQEMAAIGPVGMIFIPSKGGISHSPDEYSSDIEIERGANVLLRTLMKLDKK